MADFQTVSAALGVVQLAAVTIGLVKKVVAARAEAQTWLGKIEQMRDVNKSIAKIVQRRVERRQRIPRLMIDDDLDLEKRIKGSVAACEKCLQKMEKRLAPLKKYTEKDIRRRIPHAVQYLFAKDEIETQERIISKHVDGMSLLLLLLNSVDQSAAHEHQLETNELMRSLVRLYTNNNDDLANLPRVSTEPPEDAGLGTPEDEQSPVTTESSPEQSPPEEDQKFDLSTMSDDQTSLLEPGENPFIIAVKLNQPGEVQSLIENPDVARMLYNTDVEQRTILHHAVRSRSPEVLSVLLDTGFIDKPGFVDKFSKQGHTALMTAARFSDYAEAQDLAKLLIKGGCDINIPDRDGRTALCYAIEDPPRDESEAFVKLLIDHGAEVTIVQERMPKQTEKYTYLEEKVRSQKADSRSDGRGIGRKISRTFSE